MNCCKKIFFFKFCRTHLSVGKEPLQVDEGYDGALRRKLGQSEVSVSNYQPMRSDYLPGPR